MKSTFINAIFGTGHVSSVCPDCLRPKKPWRRLRFPGPRALPGPVRLKVQEAQGGQWDNWSLVVLSNSRGFSEISGKRGIDEIDRVGGVM